MPDFSFIQLSDPHLSSLKGVRYRQLLSKRILGYLSWRKHRRHEHRQDVLETLRHDIADYPSDHLLITGDLTHISLPHEFIQAKQWLESLGKPRDVTVIPGNHDTYVRLPWEEGLAHWQAYMQSDTAPFEGGNTPSPISSCIKRTGKWLDEGLLGGGDASEHFPILRIRGPVAFIGLSTAVPMPPFFATGWVGKRQLQDLEKLLERTRVQGLFRVVFLHHPPVPGQEKWRKRLIDAKALCAVLAKAGAELVLHGHSHRAVDSAIDIPRSHIRVFGIPSSSAVGLKPGRAAQYMRYTVSTTDEGWHLAVSARDYLVDEHRFVDGRATEITIVRT